MKRFFWPVNKDGKRRVVLFFPSSSLFMTEGEIYSLSLPLLSTMSSIPLPHLLSLLPSIDLHFRIPNSQSRKTNRAKKPVKTNTFPIREKGGRETRSGRRIEHERVKVKYCWYWWLLNDFVREKVNEGMESSRAAATSIAIKFRTPQNYLWRFFFCFIFLFLVYFGWN